MSSSLTVNAFVPIPCSPSTGKAFLWGLGAFVTGASVLIGLLSGRFELFMGLIAVGWMAKNATRAAQTSRFEHRQATLSVDAGFLSVTIPRYKQGEPQTTWLLDPSKAPITVKTDSTGKVTICYNNQPSVQLKLASSERVRLDAFLTQAGILHDFADTRKKSPTSGDNRKGGAAYWQQETAKFERRIETATVICFVLSIVLLVLTLSGIWSDMLLAFDDLGDYILSSPFFLLVLIAGLGTMTSKKKIAIATITISCIAFVATFVRIFV